MRIGGIKWNPIRDISRGISHVTHEIDRDLHNPGKALADLGRIGLAGVTGGLTELGGEHSLGNMLTDPFLRKQQANPLQPGPAPDPAKATMSALDQTLQRELQMRRANLGANDMFGNSDVMSAGQLLAGS